MLAALRPGTLLIALVVLVSAAGGCAVLAGFAAGLTAFADAGYPDSAMLLRVRDVAANGRIYPDLHKPPYLASIYGPLIYGLFAGVHRLAEMMGLDPVIALRLFVAVCFGLCVLCVFAIVRRAFGSGKSAWLAAFFSVSHLHLAGWTTQLRGDFPALALSLSSIWGILGATRPSQVALAAVGAGAAVLVKQTFVAAPASVALWLIYERRRRDAAVWIGVCAFMVLAGYGFAYWREPLLLQHIAALRNPATDFGGAAEIAWQALTRPTTLFAIAGIALVVREGPRYPLLLPAYLVCAWAIALVTVPQAGGNINYFWEPLFVAAVLAGPALWRLRGAMDRADPLIALIVLLVVGRLAVPLLREDAEYLAGAYRAATHYQEQKAEWEALASIVSGTRLLSTTPEIAVLSSRPEVPDPYLNSVLAQAGVWTYAPIAAQTAAGVYDLIIVRENEQQRDSYRGVSHWPPELWDAIELKYEPTCLIHSREVWLPREGDSEIALRLAAIGCQLIDGGRS